MRKQYEQAIAEAERAITLDPNNADGYADLAVMLTVRGGRKKPWGWWRRRCGSTPIIPSNTYLA